MFCRPVFLYREEDWEKEKKAYVDLVMSDMTDNTEDGKTLAYCCNWTCGRAVGDRDHL